jgi:hypothetical protein
MSTVGTITDAICTIVVADTDAKFAVVGTKDSTTANQPFAQVAFDDGDIDIKSIGEGVFDVEGKLYIMVDGGSFEQVEAVLEELLYIFLEQPNHQTLVALGLIDITPTRLLPALNFDSNTSKWRGASHFDIKYRVTYGSP